MPEADDPTVVAPPFDPLAWSAAAVPLVETYEDVQRTRIALENRARSIEQAGVDPPAAIVSQVEELRRGEHEIGLAVKRVWRGHPLAPWARDVHGLGEHTACIMLALLGGDPVVARPKRWVDTPGQEHKRTLVEDEPFARTVGQLWQYCGVGSPGRRQRGMTQDEALALGNPRLKMRLRLAAEGMLKAGNRDVYDAERERMADREDWTDGHKHAHALRVTGKRLLQDMYDAWGALVDGP